MTFMWPLTGNPYQVGKRYTDKKIFALTELFVMDMWNGHG